MTDSINSSMGVFAHSTNQQIKHTLSTTYESLQRIHSEGQQVLTQPNLAALKELNLLDKQLGKLGENSNEEFKIVNQDLMNIVTTIETIFYQRIPELLDQLFNLKEKNKFDQNEKRSANEVWNLAVTTTETVKESIDTLRLLEDPSSLVEFLKKTNNLQK